MVGARGEVFSRRRVQDRFREGVFRDGEGDAGPSAAEGGDAAEFVLFAVAVADLRGGTAGEGVGWGMG